MSFYDQIGNIIENLYISALLYLVSIVTIGQTGGITYQAENVEQNAAFYTSAAKRLRELVGGN